MGAKHAQQGSPGSLGAPTERGSGSPKGDRRHASPILASVPVSCYPGWNLSKLIGGEVRAQPLERDRACVAVPNIALAPPRRHSGRARLANHEAVDRDPGHGGRSDARNLDRRVRKDGHSGAAPDHAR